MHPTQDYTQDYRHLSQWPVKLGRAPDHDHLVQAYALGKRRPSRRALAVAAYLSGQYWWPDDLGVAIDDAMGTPGGAANDPRNVIKELRDRGLVTIDEQPNGPRTMWSCKLTDEGEAVVADYCARRGIEDPVAAARERLLDEQDPMDQVELLQQSLEGRRLLREHLIRERDPALVRQFKNQLSSFLCSHAFPWDFEGRKLSLTWWGGYGVGANDWYEADVVMLFDKFHLPRHTVVALTQGLKSARATQPPLATMADTKSRAEEIENIRIGHLLRWLKQLALRGKAREFDDTGQCNVQKLVLTGDKLLLVEHRQRLFPGANVSYRKSEAATYWRPLSTFW